MSFSLEERHISRQGSFREGSESREWVATGETNSATVQAAALVSCPTSIATAWGVLYRQDIRVRDGGYDVFYVSVNYGKQPQGDPGGNSLHLSFSSQGATATRRWSYNTTKYPGTAFDYKGLIGVNGESVDGCQVIIPSLKLSARFTYPAAVITLAGINAFSRLTSHVNSVPFLNYAAGEVLYLGMSGSEGTSQPTELQHDFAIEGNVTNLSIGDVTGIDKAGHDYLWVDWKETTSGGKTGQQPKGVYVEQVYPRTNLRAALGFG